MHLDIPLRGCLDLQRVFGINLIALAVLKMPKLPFVLVVALVSLVAESSLERKVDNTTHHILAKFGTKIATPTSKELTKDLLPEVGDQKSITWNQLVFDELVR